MLFVTPNILNCFPIASNVYWNPCRLWGLSVSLLILFLQRCFFNTNIYDINIFYPFERSLSLITIVASTTWHHSSTCVYAKCEIVLCARAVPSFSSRRTGAENILIKINFIELFKVKRFFWLWWRNIFRTN
jgi:hypothetical protein